MEGSDGRKSPRAGLPHAEAGVGGAGCNVGLKDAQLIGELLSRRQWLLPGYVAPAELISWPEGVAVLRKPPPPESLEAHAGMEKKA